MDVLVIRKDQVIETTVYRKPSASNRYLHYTSFQSLNERLAAIKTLKNRAQQYCSNDRLLQEELNFLHQVFLENGFPESLVSKILYQNHARDRSDMSEGNGTDDRNIIIAPYHPALQQLNKKLKKHFNITTVFQKTKTLGDFILRRKPTKK